MKLVAALVTSCAIVTSGAIVTSCTYSASFNDCAVECRAPDQCPSGFTCGGEGFCRAAGASDTCASIRGDAGLADDAPKVSTCSGTPTACDTFVSMTECLDQDGCTFTSSTCTRTIDCSAITTNQQCINTPGCDTDIPTSSCRDIGGYCHGLSKSACESLHGTECAFAGGCGGTPQACATYTDRNLCLTQGGCDFQ